MHTRTWTSRACRIDGGGICSSPRQVIVQPYACRKAYVHIYGPVGAADPSHPSCGILAGVINSHGGRGMGAGFSLIRPPGPGRSIAPPYTHVLLHTRRPSSCAHVGLTALLRRCCDGPGGPTGATHARRRAASNVIAIALGKLCGAQRLAFRAAHDTMRVRYRLQKTRPWAYIHQHSLPLYIQQQSRIIG